MTATTLLDFVTMVSALGCATIAGIFLAFSTSVMKALGALPPAHGIAAMQSINVVIINPWFLGTFLGTAVTCVVMIVAALLRWDEPVAAYRLVGGVLYLVGALLVTMIFNVPRNEALAAVASPGVEAERLWADYLVHWTAWNHVRAAAALAAAVVFTLAVGVQ